MIRFLLFVIVVGAVGLYFTNPTTAEVQAQLGPSDDWSTQVLSGPLRRRFLMLKEQAPSDASPINVVVNWFDELTRLVPTP